jgi:hypothetical protein
MVGLAGCSALPDGTELSGDESDGDDSNSDDSNSDDSNGSETDRFDYRKYLLDPDELGIDEYYFTYAQPNIIAENEDNFDEDIYQGVDENSIDIEEQRFDTIVEQLDVDFDEISNIVEYDGITVFTVEPNTDTTEDIVELLEEEEGLDTEDEIGGYDVYIGEQQRSGVAIQDNNIIFILDAEDASDRLELVIDAANGEEDQYGDAYDSFEVLLNNLGTGVRMGGRAFAEPGDANLPGLDNVVAVGNRLIIDGETSDDRVVYVFEDEADVDVEDTREFVENEGFFEDAEEFNVSQSGRAAIVNAEFDTDELEFIV